MIGAWTLHLQSCSFYSIIFTEEFLCIILLLHFVLSFLFLYYSVYNGSIKNQTGTEVMLGKRCNKRCCLKQQIEMPSHWKVYLRTDVLWPNPVGWLCRWNKHSDISCFDGSCKCAPLLEYAGPPPRAMSGGMPAVSWFCDKPYDVGQILFQSRLSSKVLYNVLDYEQVGEDCWACILL